VRQGESAAATFLPFSRFVESPLVEKEPFSRGFSNRREYFQNIYLGVFRVFLERPIGRPRFPESYAVFSEIFFPDFRFVWSLREFFVDGG
jgi:hypothetical protein